jgi:protein-disulfide isomerase
MNSETLTEPDFLVIHKSTVLPAGTAAPDFTLKSIDARRVINEILTGVHTERVREDFRCGARAGVNGTPTFFINGTRYDGEVEADRLIARLANSD